MSTLGDNLRELREKRGWSQKYVAQKMKIKQSSTYANWEYGIRDPDTETLSRLADLYEVTTDYLLGKDNRDPTEKLIGYLEMELTDEEIIERMNFKVDNLTLSVEEIKEFIAFVRAKRFMKSGPASASKPGELLRGQE